LPSATAPSRSIVGTTRREPTDSFVANGLDAFANQQ
jgi:hypothetical protein